MINTGIFGIGLYPDGHYMLDAGKAIGYGSTAYGDSLWIEYRDNNTIKLMYGTLDDLVKSGFNRIHSKVIETIEIKEKHATFNNRDFKGQYRLYQKDNAFWLKITINFKRMSIDDLVFDGPIIRNADYKYYKGLLKKDKKENNVTHIYKR